MKTNWQRHDKLAQHLFECESSLLRGPIVKTAPDVLKSLEKEFEALAEAGIANSHGLDHFLQLAMAWITTYLGEKAQGPNFRATVSLYLQPLKAILVKPCLVYPGRCQAPQPTISLNAEPPGTCGGIGHTGVSMLLNRILYCRPGEADCSQYIPIDSGSTDAARTFAALCIPLDFQALENGLPDQSSSAPCAITKAECENAPASKVNARAQTSRSRQAELRARWVLNIECLSKDLDRPFAGAILKDPKFGQVLEKMIVTLDTYQKHRDMHRALERSSTLLALATNTMRPRPAYRALLREISSLCDGADVTLHLRDLFDHNRDPEEDRRHRDRCSVYVAGVGNNFRDFLINERIGLQTGQIGWALCDEEPEPGQVSNSNLVLRLPGGSEFEDVRVQYIVGEEIKAALSHPDHALPYKQLMPETCLNVTVPIYFHKMKIGVINIEWDPQHLEQGFQELNLGPVPSDLHGKDRDLLEQKYLSDRLPLVYRMADYLSLVIDYFDDIDHLAKPPTSEEALDPEVMKRINHRGALRKIMSYYVQQGMISADKQAKEGITNLREAERRCLRDLVDAVGYFLATTTVLRILVSVRRTVERPEGLVLERHVWHWLEGDSNSAYQANLSAPIPIEDMKTVLATTAYRGVPLFGQIIAEAGKLKMVLDPTWQELFKNPHDAGTDAKIDVVPYSPAGPQPRYETAVPLVFGKRLLGTFDFEQFELEPAGELKLGLDRRELCAHLEWGRAISFLIAYLEDAKLKSGVKSKHFSRFQLLCAQLIAEVPVEAEQFREIATDAFAEIIPVEDVNLHQNLTAETIAGRQFAQLGFRGGGNDWLTWKISENQSESSSQPTEVASAREASRALLDSPFEAESGKTVPAMMVSYHALIQELQPKPSEDPFFDAIERIVHDLQIKELDLLDESLDVGESVLGVFSFLDEALHRCLKPQPGKPHKVKDYAWFLHVLCFDPETGRQALVCNPDSATPDKRLAYCNTQEMEEIVNTVMKVPEGTRVKELREVLKQRTAKSKSTTISDAELDRVIKAMEKDLQGELTDERLRNAITVWLSRPKLKHRPKPRKSDDVEEFQQGDESDDEKRSSGFTWSVAKAGHPIVVPQINLSPNRSERDSGWFWEYPYTVLGIPFKLNLGDKPDEECIAVLNIFRRRESSSDMNFFRIDERDKARELTNAFNRLLEKLVMVKQYPVLSNDALSAGFSDLKRELIERARDKKKKLIVIQTPFARSSESFEELCKHVFANATEPQLRNPVFLPEQAEDRSFTDHNVVMRLGEQYKGVADKLNELGPQLAKDAGVATRVFLFVSNSQDIEQKGVPAYSRYFSLDTHDDSLLHRDRGSKEELLYSQWLLGTARSISSGTGVLARSTGEYSHSAFEAWALEVGKATERADYYTARAHLKKRPAWRPSNEMLSLAAFEKEGEAK